MLATIPDVEERLGRPLEDDELTRVEGLLREGSAQVEGWCNRSFDDPIPDAVRIVTSRMVARVLGVPDESTGFAPGVESAQLSAGSFQMTQRFNSDGVSGGPWLSKADRLALRRFRRGVANVSMW